MITFTTTILLSSKVQSMFFLLTIPVTVLTLNSLKFLSQAPTKWLWSVDLAGHHMLIKLFWSLFLVNKTKGKKYNKNVTGQRDHLAIMGRTESAKGNYSISLSIKPSRISIKYFPSILASLQLVQLHI